MKDVMGLNELDPMGGGFGRSLRLVLEEKRAAVEAVPGMKEGRCAPVAGKPGFHRNGAGQLAFVPPWDLGPRTAWEAEAAEFKQQQLPAKPAELVISILPLATFGVVEKVGQPSAVGEDVLEGKVFYSPYSGLLYKALGGNVLCKEEGEKNWANSSGSMPWMHKQVANGKLKLIPGATL